jgi:hypothetical protein
MEVREELRLLADVCTHVTFLFFKPVFWNVADHARQS